MVTVSYTSKQANVEGQWPFIFSILALVGATFLCTTLIVRFRIIPLYIKATRQEWQGVPLTADSLIDNHIYTCVGSMQYSTTDSHQYLMLQEDALGRKLVLTPNNPNLKMTVGESYMSLKTSKGNFRFVPWS